MAVNRPYTYLMTDGRHFKIGSSLNPHKRLKQIQTGNPFCKLLGYTKRFTEAQLHKRYKKYRVSGEWFDLPNKEAADLAWKMKRSKKNKKKDISTVNNVNLYKYRIPYGEFKGRKLCSMLSIDEIIYIRKQIRELPRFSEEWKMFTRWSHEYSVNNPINK